MRHFLNCSFLCLLWSWFKIGTDLANHTHLYLPITNAIAEEEKKSITFLRSLSEIRIQDKATLILTILESQFCDNDKPYNISGVDMMTIIEVTLFNDRSFWCVCICARAHALKSLSVLRSDYTIIVCIVFTLAYNISRCRAL